MNRKGLLSLLIVATLLSLPAYAGVFQVTINGEVEFNQIGVGPLAAAASSDAASISFLVDSDVFVDSGVFPTRGYVIDPASFSFTAGGATVGMANPLPPGTTPYFIVRNDDPAVDGFFLGTNVDGFPNGVPSDSDGAFGPFTPNFSVTYLGDTLTSLAIEDAVGFYDFTGLTVFGFTVDDGPFNAMGLVFSDMSIQAIPLPAAVWLFAPALLALRRRRA